MDDVGEEFCDRVMRVERGGVWEIEWGADSGGLRCQAAGVEDGAVGLDEDGFDVFEGFDELHALGGAKEEAGGGEGVAVHGGGGEDGDTA